MGCKSKKRRLFNCFILFFPAAPNEGWLMRKETSSYMERKIRNIIRMKVRTRIESWLPPPLRQTWVRRWLWGVGWGVRDEGRGVRGEVWRRCGEGRRARKQDMRCGEGGEWWGRSVERLRGDGGGRRLIWLNTALINITGMTVCGIVYLLACCIEK